MDFLYAELEKMGVRALAMELIRDKDGAAVARVDTAEGPRVLKAFHGGGQAREIGNYAALAALGVPTLRVYAATESALLMEDIDGGKLRRGVEADLGDGHTARLIARWYRELHSRGYGYAAAHAAELYDENRALTPEALERVKERSGTGGLPVWRLIGENWRK